MGIFIGNSEIKNIYLGTTPVKEVYVGTTKVRPMSTPRLPAEYQEVEYIESNGTQAIETDVTYLTAPFKVEVKYMKQNTDTSDQTLVGQRQLGKFVNIYNNYYENLWSSTAAGTASGDNNIHTIVTDSSAGLYKDGTLLVSGTSGSRKSNYPLLIFAFSEDTIANAKWFLKGRIYEVKIQCASFCRLYIPCYRKSDGVVGMYEMINGEFKVNGKTGTFTKGPDVSQDFQMKAIEFLLVGGGGGAGAACGGGGAGGGGGGYVEGRYFLPNGSYPITIGSGGCVGCNGGNSTFDGFTAYGGGYGACGVKGGASGGQGGSGGGVTYATSTGEIGCPGQGNQGGGGYTVGSGSSGCSYGGGGGGAGSDGTRAYPNRSCDPRGGDGKCSCISGQCRWYAGGGGGCTNCYGRGTPGCGSSACGCCGGGGTSGGSTRGCQGIFIVRYLTECGYNITGGTKYTCGNYTIHCFISSGTLTVG